jgi:hypothetical protein
MPRMVYNGSGAAAVESVTARVLQSYPEASAAIRRAVEDAKASRGKTADVHPTEVAEWQAQGWELAS